MNSWQATLLVGFAAVAIQVVVALFNHRLLTNTVATRIEGINKWVDDANRDITRIEAEGRESARRLFERIEKHAEEDRESHDKQGERIERHAIKIAKLETRVFGNGRAASETSA